MVLVSVNMLPVIISSSVLTQYITAVRCFLDSQAPMQKVCRCGTFGPTTILDQDSPITLFGTCLDLKQNENAIITDAIVFPPANQQTSVVMTLEILKCRDFKLAGVYTDLHCCQVLGVLLE